MDYNRFVAKKITDFHTAARPKMVSFEMNTERRCVGGRMPKASHKQLPIHIKPLALYLRLTFPDVHLSCSTMHIFIFIYTYICMTLK